jgi:hypothetical protein
MRTTGSFQTRTTMDPLLVDLLEDIRILITAHHTKGHSIPEWLKDIHKRATDDLIEHYMNEEDPSKVCLGG